MDSTTSNISQDYSQVEALAQKDIPKTQDIRPRRLSLGFASFVCSEFIKAII